MHDKEYYAKRLKEIEVEGKVLEEHIKLLSKTDPHYKILSNQIVAIEDKLWRYGKALFGSQRY